MIVVDTNALVYILRPGPRHRAMEGVLRRDGRWAAPRLWRSELRNFLATSMRRRDLDLEEALAVAARAETLLGDEDYESPTPAVLDLCRRSGCTAYDAEFVALALALGVPLVTGDREVLDAFPEISVSPEAFSGQAR